MKKEKSNKPGVMIYFDIRRQVERLSREQCGDLLMAILDFAEFGTEPTLDDMTGMCFDGLRPRIERDGKKYEDKVQKSKYAVYVRETEKHGEIPLDYAEWERSQEPEFWL